MADTFDLAESCVGTPSTMSDRAHRLSAVPFSSFKAPPFCCASSFVFVQGTAAFLLCPFLRLCPRHCLSAVPLPSPSTAPPFCCAPTVSLQGTASPRGPRQVPRNARGPTVRCEETHCLSLALPLPLQHWPQTAPFACASTAPPALATNSALPSLSLPLHWATNSASPYRGQGRHPTF